MRGVLLFLALVLLVIVLLYLGIGTSHAQSSVVTLTWEEGTGSNETEFRIERKAEICAGPGAFAQIATVGANIFTFQDKTVVQGQTYCWRVLAANPDAVSGPSNLAGKRVPFVAPPAPVNLIVQ